MSSRIDGLELVDVVGDYLVHSDLCCHAVHASAFQAPFILW